MKKTILLFVLSYFVVPVKAQVSLKANTLFLLNYVNGPPKTILPGFDLAVDIKLTPRLVFRSGIHVNSSLSIDHRGTLSGSYRTETYYENAGLRCMLKRYSRPSKDKTLPAGFFWGVFSDVFASRRRVVKSRGASVNYVPSESVIYYHKVEAKGLFIGGGLCLGYTWKIKKWLIEPNFGIGYGTATNGVLKKPDPNAFPYDPTPIENALIRISPTHIELHFGREF